jgi:hypothetical protein
MNIKQLHDTLNNKLNLNLPLSWVTLFLFLLSLLFRLAFINKGFFHHDAILLLDAVEQSVTEKTLVPLLDGRYTLVAFHVPFYLLFRALGFPIDISFNVLTALLAALSVVLLYLLARELTADRFTAAAAGLLFAFTPAYFVVSTHTMPHPLSVCLVLLAFYLVLLGHRRGSNLCYGMASTAMVLGISARIPNILLVPSFLLVYLDLGIEKFRIRFDRQKFGKPLVFWAAPLAIGLALIYYVQIDALRAKAGYDAFLGFFSPYFRLGLNNILTNFGVVGCLLLALGIVLSFREKKPACYAALLLWLVVMVFFYGNVRSYADRFYSIVFPLIALFIALGLKWIASFSRVFAWAVLLYLTVSMWLLVYPVAKDRHQYSGEKEYSLWLNQKTEPNAVIIVMDESVFVRYYGRRRTMDHPEGSVELAEEWASDIKAYLRNGVPVYLMESGLSYDPGQIIEQTLLKHFNLIYVGAHMTEDYHDNMKSFLQREVYDQRLFRLVERR